MAVDQKVRLVFLCISEESPRGLRLQHQEKFLKISDRMVLGEEIDIHPLGHWKIYQH